MATRIEKDTMGEIAVPADRYWGAQTQRSLLHFRISTETMPEALIRALLIVKRSAARVNTDLGLLPARIADAIVAAAARSDAIFMVGMVLRFWPEYVELQRLVAHAEITAGGDLTGRVAVAGDDTCANRIRANSIYANGALGIDLGDDGVTPNDPGDADTGPRRRPRQRFFVYRRSVTVRTEGHRRNRQRERRDRHAACWTIRRLETP